jgi:hypothetical protein
MATAHLIYGFLNNNKKNNNELASKKLAEIFPDHTNYFFNFRSDLAMNSGELKVDVPLASMESDCEDSGSTLNTPSRTATDNKLRARAALKKQTLAAPRLTNLDHAGGDSMAGSLEDLVNSFDEKLTMCFQDYQEQVDKIAPVQVCAFNQNCRTLDRNHYEL